LVSWLQAAVQVGADTESRLGSGLIVTLIGMGVVFGVLFLLYGLMVLIGRVGAQQTVRLGSTQAAGSSEPDAKHLEPAACNATVQSQTPSDALAGRRNVQIVAAVAAALAAAMESEAPPGFVPPSPRRAGTGRMGMSWALAGRMELVTARERLPRG
jgi:Na+-transporting methylmalonyl-CoA/oxaloacetate decarboxylase gamma subunit